MDFIIETSGPASLMSPSHLGAKHELQPMGWAAKLKSLHNSSVINWLTWYIDASVSQPINAAVYLNLSQSSPSLCMLTATIMALFLCPHSSSFIPGLVVEQPKGQIQLTAYLWIVSLGQMYLFASLLPMVFFHNVELSSCNKNYNVPKVLASLLWKKVCQTPDPGLYPIFCSINP